MIQPIFSEAEQEVLFKADAKKFLEKRWESCARGTPEEMLLFALKLMEEIRVNESVLEALCLSEAVVRIAEGKDGSDVNDYEMRFDGGNEQ